MEKEIQKRYWEAFKSAIEDYVVAADRNENGQLIHCLARVVKLREADLDKVEQKAA